MYMTLEELNKLITASDERIAFCFKLWIKELLEPDEDEDFDKSDARQWVIIHALNEILNGEYCSDEEFAKRKEMFPPIE